MKSVAFPDRTPEFNSYDVIIIGGAIMGVSSAWWLTELGFDGRILVVESDPSYANCSTAHTNSCIRQQFSTELNIRISQFTAAFISAFPEHMQDERAPNLKVENFGYLYLADSETKADALRASAETQRACGVPTRLLSRDEIAAQYPFYNLDDIVLGSINTKDEGYWDGGTVFEWWRRSSRSRGVEFVANTVTGFRRSADGLRVDAVELSCGTNISAGCVVNATGPRAAVTARMAGLDLPVEPRKRYSWAFLAETPLLSALPLTIDPSGIHVRKDGPATYLAGSKGLTDPAVAPDDFTIDPNLWMDHVWPTLAARIPAFESIRIVNEWAGHYAYNTLDQNAVVGPHPDLINFLFLNGFSGHGLQQSPAMGRGTAEQIVFGEYRTLDLTPFHIDRILEGRSVQEHAVI